MKEINKRVKILALLIAIIIIVGLIVITTIGLNFDLRYQESKRIQLYLGKEFEITDMKQIVEEVLPNQAVIIQKVEVFEDTVSIVTKDMTEEQKNDILQKVNEKYQIELSQDSVKIVDVPHTQGRDIIRPYVLPFTIATIIILVYMLVRYYKLGMIKIVLKTGVLLVVAQTILLSVMAITRIPIGRLTIPLILTIYVLSLVGITTYFEKELRDVVSTRNKE